MHLTNVGLELGLNLQSKYGAQQDFNLISAYMKINVQSNFTK